MWRASHGKLRDELLAREVFGTLLEAKVLIERWRRGYNTLRPHRSLGYRPRSRAARVRSLRLRLSQRTGPIPWQGYPGDRARDWFHSWGQVKG